MNARALAAVLLAAACRSAGRTRVSNGDVEVGRVSAEAATRSTAGSARSAMRGDWVLRDRDLRVTVTGAEGPARNERPGTVAQVAVLSVPDVEAVRTLAPVLRVGGREVALTDARFEAALDGALPVLRVTARARAAAASLDVVRDYSLETGRRALHLRTRVTNVGRTRVEGVAWGVRVEWGGAAPFAPGVGAVTADCDARAPWVGLASRGLAAAWARLSGDRRLALRFASDMHGATAVAGHTDALSPAVALAPSQSAGDHCALLVAPGDLTEVARAVAFAHGEAVAEASLVLLGDARDPTVTVLGPEGTPVLLAHPKGRAISLPLAAGDYVATATAPGHAPSDPVRFTVTRASAGAVPVEVAIPPGGHIRVEAHDEESGRDVPVRVTVRGVEGTRDPDFGPHDRAAGAGVIAVAPQGRTEVPVPPGRYRVTVSHGPEWTLYEREVTVTETLRGDVSARIRRAVPMGGWAACDLHVHANPSFDSRVTVEDRVASLVAEGVDFATPTEHNVVGDYAAGVAMLPESIAETLLWVPAVEVTTDRSAQPMGHFNVYPYRPDPASPGGAPPPFLNASPRQIFRAARANNPDAMIQVNHPRMQPNIGYFNVTGLDPRTGRAVSPEYDPSYDAIEVFNGFYLAQPAQVEAVLRDWMSLVAAGHRYVGTGSSDSHRVAYQWAGYPRTYVHAGGAGEGGDGSLEPTAILRALRQGRAFVTSGPMLFLNVGDREPGDTVEVGAQEPVAFRVRVLAAPWIPVESVELYRDGERVASLAMRPSRSVTRLDTETTLPVSPGSFVLAVARGPRGGLNPALPLSEGVPFAFTNPVFFAARATPPRGR